MSARIVIIGGGLAAATAAEELRERDFDGAIDLVAAEAHRPYQRPPLSKGYLKGTEELESVFVHPAGWEAEHQVTLHVSNPAVRILDHTVELADGTILQFDRLLVATGAQPRQLELPGENALNVHSFRTLDDSNALRIQLAAGGKRVVCIGAGWIGLELAAAAREYDNQVTMVMREEIPLAAALGDDMGMMFRELHEEHGVVFLSHRATLEIECDKNGVATGVRTDREVIPADTVIIGVGVLPDTTLAETIGIEIDHGILVDERMQTSVPDIFAAGDVVNAFHPRLGEHIRGEHWAKAIASGKVAASSMLGGDATLDGVPYFYTDQYDLGMEYSGFGSLSSKAQLVIRGDRAVREFIAFWVADGCVVAGMNVNVWDVNDQVQRLIRERVRIDVAQLADNNVHLEDIV